MAKPTFPDFVPPMMEESTKAPFDSQDWIFEIKLDGYPGNHGFRFCQQSSPLVTQRTVVGSEISGDR
jgi:hypothetical protein